MRRGAMKLDMLDGSGATLDTMFSQKTCGDIILPSFPNVRDGKKTEKQGHGSHRALGGARD